MRGGRRKGKWYVRVEMVERYLERKILIGFCNCKVEFFVFLIVSKFFIYIDV